MRFVVYGAGAIGGVLGGRLHEAGHEVVLIARGDPSRRHPGARPAHRVAPRRGDGARDRGRRSERDRVPRRRRRVPLHEGAAHRRRGACPRRARATEHRVVSVQNGVANEPTALRYFAGVYGMCVMCPAVHLEPGIVEASSAPVSGILDIGCFPHGVDERAKEVSDAVAGATFHSVPRTDIMRWKYGKLMNNLSNALDALCGPATPRRRARPRRARAEARRVPRRRQHRLRRPRRRPRAQG